MGRKPTARYDYPKKEQSLTEISQRLFGKRYIETTDAEMRKVKSIFRKIHK
jgi:hypothetical protein|tara:strand:+ start:18 stop:170 length:153 start_codon:yes stop_codon:yes gene_type:complete